ncbi:MAG: TrmH family RNA methyltransferase [Bacteroidota bacterium]
MDREQQLIRFLSQFVSEHKLNLMEQVLAMRTRYLTVVLEDLYQSQNASAVVRTCECLGIQDVHVIEDTARYGTNKKVLKGSHYWVDIIKHRIKAGGSVRLEADALRNRGYRVLVTSVDRGSKPLHEIDVTAGPIALVMGNELKGTSAEVVAAADGLVHIPMHGFTESFNVSVSAAICLSGLRDRMTAAGVPWQLRDEEKNDLRLRWLRTMVNRSELLEREFLKTLV